MKRYLSSSIIAAALVCGIVATPLSAASPETAEPDALEMSVDENHATPEVPKKAKTYVVTAMDQLRRHLVKNGMTIEPLRDGEVLEITIPCSVLFASGSLELKKAGAEFLRPLGMVAREPNRYKMLVTVHTDDTGDDAYADSISAARANAIDDYLWQLAGEKETNVIPYGIGKDEPRLPNTSRTNREANRRAEIFIVPDDGLLEMAGVKRK